MRILFLEDDESRIRKARQGFIGHQLRVVTTALAAIAELRACRFDLVSLDHDLGGGQMSESDENSGYAVAQFIAETEERPAVIVHSFNPVGAQNMMDCLGGNCGRALFDTPQYWRMILPVKENSHE